MESDQFEHEGPVNKSHGDSRRTSQELPQEYLKSRETHNLVGGIDPPLFMSPDQVADVVLSTLTASVQCSLKPFTSSSSSSTIYLKLIFLMQN